MTRKEIKHYKKLIGVYNRCIDACTFNKNTKHFRKLTQNRINKITGLMKPVDA